MLSSSQITTTSVTELTFLQAGCQSTEGKPGEVIAESILPCFSQMTGYMFELNKAVMTAVVLTVV